jgi:hypothetical protein
MEEFMFSSKKIRYAAVAVALGFGLGASLPAAAAQAANDLSAYVGKWQINLGKTKMGRMGPTGQNLQRDPTFTWIFTPQGQGLRMDVYTKYPQPSATRTMTVIADAKPRGCDASNQQACLTRGGEADNQTYSYVQMDARLIARIFYIKGEVYEYSTYAVSKDGKTLSIVSWDPGTPEYHNIQVFDKQP